MKRSTLLILAVALLLAFPQFAGARDFYKVGVITSLSGPLATGGNVTKYGYDMWANTVNAQGGIEIQGKKYKVQLYYSDAQSEPSQAASGAERLATQEKVDFVLGPYSSGSTLGAAPVLEKYKIPMITGSAESPLVWKQKFKYTFGTIPPVNFTGAGAIKTIALMKPTPKKAVILGSNDAFSKATAETFKEASEAAGIKVMKFSIVPQAQDLIPYMSAVKVMRPDFIGFGGHDDELINLAKALRQINYTPKALLMHYGVTEPAFINALGKDAEYILGGSVWTGSLNTKGDILWKDAKSYFESAKKAFGIDVDYTHAASTAAGIAFQAALKKIKATPPLKREAQEALIKALEELDINTFYGRINFATEGQFYHANVGLDPLTIQIQNGKVKIVGPKEYAETESWYPMKPWKER